MNATLARAYVVGVILYPGRGEYVIYGLAAGQPWPCAVAVSLN